MRRLLVSTFCIFSISAFSISEAQDQLVSIDSFNQLKDMTRTFYCPTEKHETYQKELKLILKADQSDRKTNDVDIVKNDTQRRVRVAEIAAIGCLISTQDYEAASLIYQHGVVPEHYLKAIIYANKAAILGAKNDQRSRQMNSTGLRQVTIDRYLMSLGKAQLFGTQIVSPVFYKQYETEADNLPCIWPIDPTFDILTENEMGSPEYRLDSKQKIKAISSQIETCDFPVKSSKHLLQSLLNLDI